MKAELEKLGLLFPLHSRYVKVYNGVRKAADSMQISEVVQKLNITARAIRFYEEKGLIAPLKQSHNQYRKFTEQEVWRLQTIIALREVGMSLEDIKSALQQIDKGDYDELPYYLELQRSVMFAQWLELKQMITTTDELIELVKQKKQLPLSGIYALALGSKKLRETRTNWRDTWGFDSQAVIHDSIVQGQHEESSDYKDYDKALDEVVKLIDPHAGECGLDLGTGTGNLAGRFLDAGIAMAGVDQSKEMLRQCRHKFPGMETKLGNLLAVPYLDSHFDFVVSSFAFHHLNQEQKEVSLSEICRILKPKGRICIADLMVAEDNILQRNDSVRRLIAEDSYTRLPDLLEWFETHQFYVEYKRMNELLYIVTARRA